MTRAALPITALVATRNEAKNIERCLHALSRVERRIVIDSGSVDGTIEMARDSGAEVVHFKYQGGYPKKRQWALDSLPIKTDWVCLVDADEVVPDELWAEIEDAIRVGRHDAYLVCKGFHFLGRKFRFGGFSHRAVFLFRAGRARFEELVKDSERGLDMEVHERVLVDGTVGELKVPLIHEDFKGLEAYLARHNAYSTWEAKLRVRYLSGGDYGDRAIRARLLGDIQERRRFMKLLIIWLPFEPWLWFFYHYVFRLGFLEGRRGLIACQIRADYIRQVRAKMFELTDKSRP